MKRERKCQTCGKAIHKPNNGDFCSRDCYIAGGGVSGEKPAPTPSVIAMHAAEIRATWTKEERQRRLRPDWRRQHVGEVLEYDERAL